MQKKVVEFNTATRAEAIEYRGGDVVRVYRKIKEGEKERVQVFEGMIIAMKGGQSSSRMMTIRKVSTGGYGVEIVIPIESPMVEKIELVKRAKVRRSKLYYIREKAAKALRFKFTEGDKIVRETPDVLAQEAEEVVTETEDSNDDAKTADSAETTSSQAEEKKDDTPVTEEKAEVNPPTSDDSGVAKEEKKEEK